jgi:hypothetical protein
MMRFPLFISKPPWLIAELFAGVILLEFVTPPAYSDPK